MIGWPIASPRSRTVPSLILVAETAPCKSLAEHGRSAVVVDRAEYVRHAPRPAVQADATRLPFRAECFAAVAALWMLLPGPAWNGVDRIDPGTASGRNLRRVTSSRYKRPRIRQRAPHWGEPFSFDAETAPEIISDHFTITEVITWDTPAVLLLTVPRWRNSSAAAGSVPMRLRCRPVDGTSR